MHKYQEIIHSSRQPLLLIGIVLLTIVGYAHASNHPWSLDSAFRSPDWLSISGEHRARYETLDEQFRAGGNGDDQILVFRTNILARVTWHQWEFGVELLDSRQAHGDDSTRITSGDVNPLDILQTYATWSYVDPQTQVTSQVRVGRFTMDVGSRRLVARNKFRNAINSFTGLDWQRTTEKDEQFRAFYTLPVNRLPAEFERRQHNRSEGDDQDTEVAFWGLYYKLPKPTLNAWKSDAELFYFGLDENDTHNRPTRNRDIHTVGGRLYRKKVRNHFDYELEAVYQFGESRATSAEADREDLGHTAYFAHAELGYSFDAGWSPRLIAQFDYASGDSDPDDGDNNRYDSLFSVRRGDFGPLGIYGPFARANIVSPGLRLQLKPSSKVSMFVAHRGYWLASDRDAFVVAGVRDPEGDSGSYLGQQLEARLRWDIFPENLRWEIGAAYLFKGGFANDAPNANDQGDSNFLYSQATFSF
ncbi:MAG: alginate export family protein [Gammaproteobacteria bacterium]